MTPIVERKIAGFDSPSQNLTTTLDPVTWQEVNLKRSVYTNQIEITNAIFDPTAEEVDVLGNRGGGKTEGVGQALFAFLATEPNQHFISVAPIQPQAGRLIRKMKEACRNAPAYDLIDWKNTNALRLQFRNGNWLVGVSGQETAEVEGEHGNGMVIDEAHRVPGKSISEKLMPMITAIGVRRKVIRMGVAMGKNHFFKSWNAKGTRRCFSPWYESEIHLIEPDPLFYKGKQISRQLLALMPKSYREKYFPDYPPFLEAGPSAISDLSWQTQYELEWADDINNFLTEEEYKRLGSGAHDALTRGRAGERYFAGLDTSQGSFSGRRDTDWTVLSIWRLNRDGSIDKVASFRWRNQVVDQEDEIWAICNQRNGLFPCELVFADYSNVGVSIVERFKKAGMPITGVPFGKTAQSVDSAKNWKNTLYDYFLIGLQSHQIHFPSMEALRRLGGSPEEQTQKKNISADYYEWGILQRIRKRGINDEICAPTKLEKGADADEDAAEGGLHDDGPSASVLGAYAAGHAVQLKKLMASKGGLQGYAIPSPVFGQATSSAYAPGSSAAIASAVGGENPFAERQRQDLKAQPLGTSQPENQGQTPLSDMLKMNMPGHKRKDGFI